MDYKTLMNYTVSDYESFRNELNNLNQQIDSYTTTLLLSTLSSSSTVVVFQLQNTQSFSAGFESYMLTLEK